MKIIVYYKLLLRRLFLIPSFCRICGRNVRDFQAPHKVWKIIQKDIPRGNTVCYNCFCDLCNSNNVNYGGSWKLI